MKAPAVTDPQYTIDKLRGAITLMARSRNLWKLRATERTTVAHSLWNLRTPYPTAIDCRCGQRLYRFGTELRHRDATRCGDGAFDRRVTNVTDAEAEAEAEAIDDALDVRPCQHTDANDAGVCPCGVTVTRWIGALKDGPTDLAARAKDVARNPDEGA